MYSIFCQREKSGKDVRLSHAVIASYSKFSMTYTMRLPFRHQSTYKPEVGGLFRREYKLSNMYCEDIETSIEIPRNKPDYGGHDQSS